jgi:hypothetical protein
MGARARSFDPVRASGKAVESFESLETYDALEHKHDHGETDQHDALDAKYDKWNLHHVPPLENLENRFSDR